MTERKTRRKYELGQRAETMNETRRRITNATIELHGTVGPAHTTIAGIADLAGVQRHTVYRHFPTEEDLFTACSTEYWNRNPWPETARWEEIAAPEQRLAAALGDLYEFYEQVEPMLSNVLRDAPTVPLAEQSLDSYLAYMDQAAATVSAGYGPSADAAARETTPVSHVVKRSLFDVAIRHAIAFSTWRSVVRSNDLSTTDAIRLMTALVRSSADLDPAV
ncbi:TetR/AcrR family transcriptional regulator [Streptomyces sp. NL15-2K]|uniref:TetR/AcrR family transcriptional regulator n=1 Tax=Streptomyces sp. NL15-2K TaxID=376149 RepID=UPI000FFA6A8F|nr:MULTISPECIES: TetR/AcrR family transcriptional regulator [Actinomycetes]WKX14278.1 TetR/AcrR family transcriptional regulator [Kutzneria buriramensis]GCB53388.1 tetR family transcriptional regulator [Streptomyces sp. NL15-2K]